MDHHHQEGVLRSQIVIEAVSVTKIDASQIGHHNFDAAIDHPHRMIFATQAVSKGDYLESLSGLVFHSRLESGPWIEAWRGPPN